MNMPLLLSKREAARILFGVERTEAGVKQLDRWEQEGVFRYVRQTPKDHPRIRKADVEKLAHISE